MTMTTAVSSPNVTMYVAAGDVDLAGAWDKLWSAISSEISGLLDILTIVGVALVVFSIITYFWQKRRGGNMSEGSSTIFWVMALGALLCAPQVLIPLFMTLLDQILNAAINIINR